MRPILATISKYPPYVSGHASQAVWTNTALAELTGDMHHQLTYCGPVPPPFDEVPVHVHHVAPAAEANRKVPDGHLAKAIAGRLTQLASSGHIDGIVAMYADLHASAALRAQRVIGWQGRHIPVVVTVEGSDLTDSIARHRHDGEAAVLLADVLAADAVLTVSRHVRDELLRLIGDLVGPGALEAAEHTIRVRYPGLPPTAFVTPDQLAAAELRQRLDLPPDAQILSSFTRLVPEKGVDLILELAATAKAEGRHDLVFVVAGVGAEADRLRMLCRSRDIRNFRVVVDPSPTFAQALRAVSQFGLFPSRSSPGWHETFGIAALEYQAVGTPVLTSDAPGFLESTCGPQCIVPGPESVGSWWQRILAALPERAGRSAEARRFAARFSSSRAAAELLSAVPYSSSTRVNGLRGAGSTTAGTTE